MKSIVLGMFLSITCAAFACPDISGKYQCPNEARDYDLDQFEIEFADNIQTFIFKANNLTSFYEIGVWNLDFGPTSGRSEPAYQIKAECTSNIVTLMTEDMADGEVISQFLIPKPDGLIVEFDETDDDGENTRMSFRCRKI